MIRTHRYPVSLTFAIALGLPLLALTLTPVSVLAQAPTNRIVRLTVTDPLGRMVTGLEQQHFEIMENGARRPITAFLGPDSPISIAIVSGAPAAFAFNQSMELRQSPSIADALQHLTASTNPRRALIVTTGPETDTFAVPANIPVIHSSAANLAQAIAELRSQYLLQFDSANPSADVTVALQQPRGLPALRVNVK